MGAPAGVTQEEGQHSSFFIFGGGNGTLAHIIVCYIIAAVWRACVLMCGYCMCAGRCVFACLRVCVCATAEPVLYMHGPCDVRACACKDVSGGGGGGVTVVCSAQNFAVLLLACYPSIMNEVLRNDRSRSFFWSVLQVDSHCLPVQVDIRALHFSCIH